MRRLELDPRRRHPVTRVDAAPGIARVLLDRAAASVEEDEPSQDFVALAHAPSQLCFALTDGVGSSFAGDLAARFLAQRLVDWLCALEAVPAAARLAADLAEHLHGLSTEAHELVARHEFEQEIAPYMVDVVERQRAYGSEAMFVCGRIDWPGHGAQRVGVAWLGDAQLRVYRRGAVPEDLRGRTADRWSTRAGVRGQISARDWPVAEVERVLACSDGLLHELDAAAMLSDAALDARLVAASADQNSDDMALVDVALTAGAMPSASGGPPAPRGSRPEPAAVAPPGPPPPRWRSTAGLGWESVPGADAYSVQLADGPDFANPLVYRVDGTSFAAPELGERTWARVRAHAGERTGRWGEPRELGRHAALPPPASLSAEVDPHDARLNVRWDPVRGAEAYVLRVLPPRGPATEQRVSGTRASFPVTGGSYRLSARADAGARDAEWSRPITLRIVEERWR
jgi:hypothetical protein